MNRGGEVVGIRLVGEQADRAAHRARAVQGALRPAQHFNVVDVDDPGIQRIRQRRLIEIEPGGVVTAHTTNRNRAGIRRPVTRGTESQIRVPRWRSP